VGHPRQPVGAETRCLRIGLVAVRLSRFRSRLPLPQVSNRGHRLSSDLARVRRATVYRPIWRGFGAAGLRLGVIDPIGGDPIPFAYKFFAGGRTTHRAFYTDRLGIPDQTIKNDIAVGGNALILLNLEYQRRIAGQLYAAIFIDAGNVWESPSKVSLGDIRWGPGIGLNYVTPAGPLRAEYGWNFDAEPGEDGGQFFISFGVPF